MKKLASVFAAGLLVVAGCGGGGEGSAPPGNPSNNTAICAYMKAVGSRNHVYAEMAVTPVSQKSTECAAFNDGFGGTKIPPVGRMGTSHVYCAYEKNTSSSTIKFGVFATGRATGLAFCRSFHPGPGFKRDR